jgi:hypothetical protein
MHSPAVRKWILIAIGALVFALFSAVPAFGQSTQVLGPWGGRLPFNCQIQYVGTGTAYPHPKADPFCVEFDKTNQNVAGLGLVDFLSREPARVFAAVPKCFYFQRDHWTGSIDQGLQPSLWHLDGDYFFDKALGLGGVSVHNLQVGGVTVNPSIYAPAQLKPYFYPAEVGARCCC